MSETKVNPGGTRLAAHWAFVAVVVAIGGCQAYVDLRESVVRGRTDGPSSLAPGAYSGVAECRRLSQVGSDTVLTEFTRDMAVTLSDGGLPTVDGEEVAAGMTSEFLLDTEAISRVVADISSAESFVTVAYDAGVLIDPDAASPIELVGALTETYDQETSDELLFGLVAEFTEPVEDAQISSITVTYECSATLMP